MCTSFYVENNEIFQETLGYSVEVLTQPVHRWTHLVINFNLALSCGRTEEGQLLRSAVCAPESSAHLATSYWSALCLLTYDWSECFVSHSCRKTAFSLHVVMLRNCPVSNQQSSTVSISLYYLSVSLHESWERGVKAGDMWNDVLQHFHSNCLQLKRGSLSPVGRRWR